MGMYHLCYKHFENQNNGSGQGSDPNQDPYSEDNPPKALRVSGSPHSDMNTIYYLDEGNKINNSPVWRAENGSQIIAAVVPVGAGATAGNNCWGIQAGFFTISSSDKTNNYNPADSSFSQSWSDPDGEWVSISIEVVELPE